MKKIQQFLITSIIGGLVGILPAGLTMLIFSWLYRKISSLISPLTTTIQTHLNAPTALADALVILSIAALCFLAGVLIQTRIGQAFHSRFDNVIARITPGYLTLKKAVRQILGKSEQKTPMGRPAVVQIYGTAWTLVFINSESCTGDYVLGYFPSSPLPTSGLIFALNKKEVVFLDELAAGEAVKMVSTLGIECSSEINKIEKAIVQRSKLSSTLPEDGLKSAPY